MKKIFGNTMAAALTAWVLSSAVHAQDIDAIAERVTEFTLDNGLHFIIIERSIIYIISKTNIVVRT